MKFSIIVPTYNEEQDIGKTLEALVKLEYPDREIIFVDDSTDSTPQIIESYSPRGVGLIRPSIRQGRCEARNLGIQESTGEIVVILNADVQPRPDFLDRLVPHYKVGYDYVLVNAQVINTSQLFARYIEAGTRLYYSKSLYLMEWTEGFSCRREVAISAGLFPTGFAVPLVAGEDGYFGTRLKEAGARKKIDTSITVDHIAPGTIREFWAIRKGRGKGSPQVHRYLDHWPMTIIIAWAMLKVFKNLFIVVSILPMLFIAWKNAKYSPLGRRDFLPFLWVWLVENLAFHIGEIQAIREIYDAERAK